MSKVTQEHTSKETQEQDNDNSEVLEVQEQEEKQEYNKAETKLLAQIEDISDTLEKQVVKSSLLEKQIKKLDEENGVEFEEEEEATKETKNSFVKPLFIVGLVGAGAFAFKHFVLDKQHHKSIEPLEAENVVSNVDKNGMVL